MKKIIIKGFSLQPIKQLINSMETKTKKVEIDIPVGKKIEWVNDVLTLVDEKPKEVTDRIKTFDDACHELGESHPLVKEWQMCGQNLSPDLEAYLRLRIITAALNEGWKPQFIKGERRWYFWYDFITKEQYDKLSAEDKSRVVGRGGYYAYAFFGLVCAGVYTELAYLNEFREWVNIPHLHQVMGWSEIPEALKGGAK